MVADRLVFVAAARAPARLESRVPLGVCKIAKRLHGDRRARLSDAKPSCDVLLRPEEIHRTSDEDDVVPPVCRRDQAMEQQLASVDDLSEHVGGVRVAAVGAR